MGERTAHLIFVQHVQVCQCGDKAVGQLVVEVEQAAAVQCVQIGIRSRPEGLDCLVVIIGYLLFAFAFADNGFDVGFFGNGICKMGVTIGCRRENFVLQTVVAVEFGFQRQYFCFGNAALQVRFHVLRRGRLRIVHVAADIAVEIFGFKRFLAHQAAVAVDFYLVVIDVTDFLNVFGAQRVLVFAFPVFSVGIDEEHALAVGGSGLVDNQQRSGNAGAVEQSLWQSDNTFQNATWCGFAARNEALAHFLLLAASEQYAVWHHYRHAPVVFQYRNHVLHKHKVGLFLLAHPILETLLKLHVGGGVVLRERRVGHHNIVLVECAVGGKFRCQ